MYVFDLRGQCFLPPVKGVRQNITDFRLTTEASDMFLAMAKIEKFAKATLRSPNTITEFYTVRRQTYRKGALIRVVK